MLRQLSHLSGLLLLTQLLIPAIKTPRYEGVRLAQSRHSATC